jgi:predicted hydrocarbon binding protein
MDIDQLRQKLKADIPPADPELFEQIEQRVKELAGGQFLPQMGEILQKYESGKPIRPHYPNKMQFIYMRDRQTFTFSLFPELMDYAYQAGRAIGAAFDAPRREGVTLKEAMESAIDVAHEFDYGRQEIVKVEGDLAVYRTYECADCYGLPNLGMCLCVYEAGVAAGALERTLGRPVVVKEVRCMANGDPYDEFEVRVVG